MKFRSYSNISNYFLRDYGTIAMVIILVTMVTITTVISSRVKIYMLFTGREVRMGTVFSHTDRPSPVNNMLRDGFYLPRTQQDFCRYSFIPEANNQLLRRKCLERQCRE